MSAPEAPDPLRLRPHGLAFNELKDLSEHLERIQDDAGASLAYFRHPPTGGFAHRVDPAYGPQKSSKASTSTCLAYLRATGMLTGEDWAENTRDRLRSAMIDDEWESAGLEPDNPFTVAFLLDTIHALGGRDGLDDARKATVDQKIALLNAALADTGGLSIAKYPPTAFLTQKAVRVLKQWNEFKPDARRGVRDWAWGHLYEESMVIASDSPDTDFFELAYSVLTASHTADLDRMTPRERRLLQHAIDQFFNGQRDDGTWPRSRPLFLYPDIGYAYCYDYELLVQLLSERQLAPFVSPRLAELRKAVWALDTRRVPLEAQRAYGWSSEHHGTDFEAESWPTASVFHFCFELGRLVSNAIRRDVFDYVEAIYDEPKVDAPNEPRLNGLVDSYVEHDGQKYSFKALFDEQFLEPLVRERDTVRDGRSFESGTKVSAIIYGPPGTSKTRLSGMIARALGWPLLALDPSHVTRRGLNNVHAEADALFGRLRFCDQIVVLLDEFDELVRERAAGEIESRFLTTAMLPKIAALHTRRRLVYIVATNHLEQFDAAISRPGRFDVIVPVMPPSAEAKYQKWPALARARDKLAKARPTEDIDETIGDLTYDEASDLASSVEGTPTIKHVRAAVKRACVSATLHQRVADPGTAASEGTDSTGAQAGSETWKQRIAKQQSKIRGLGL
jgi:ATPase family associated with various cellular activities (AAA)